MPKSCTTEEVATFWSELFCPNSTIDEYFQECVKPAWDAKCEHSSKNATCEQDYFVFKGVFEKFALTIQGVFEHSHFEFSCGDSSKDTLDAGAIIYIIICIVIIVCVLANEFLEYNERKRRSSLVVDEEASVLMPDKSLNSTEQHEAPIVRKGFGKFLACFSIRAGLKELLVSSPKRSLRTLDGMRALSMFWIILGHTADFQTPPVLGLSNYSIPGALLKEFSFQFMPAANFAVDTFFFLSGLLTAYVLIKGVLKKKKNFPFILAIVFRWLRIVPVLAFLVGAYATIFKYFASGPIWFRCVE